VREVGSNARRVDNIIEAKLESVSVGLWRHVIGGANNLGNQGICLEKKG
jgi:hypothetical protein